MPSYDYRCPEGHVLIVTLPYTMYDPSWKPSCPLCSRDARRLWRRPLGIHFRGSGFYATDHVLSEPENPIDVDPR